MGCLFSLGLLLGIGVLGIMGAGLGLLGTVLGIVQMAHFLCNA
jgi:hypothetical protein